MGGRGSGSKPREYPPEIVELICGMYEQGMTVAEIRRAAPKGYRVQTILERYLPSRRAAAKRDQRGPANHMWKGDQAGYDLVHVRLCAERGPASAHHCVDCGKRAHDWSYNYTAADERRRPNGTCPYSLNLDDYSPRCRSCHRRFDRAQKEVMPNVS